MSVTVSEGSEADLSSLVEIFWNEQRVHTDDRIAFLGAQFDAGLAWVHHPRGLGGLGLPRWRQAEVDARLRALGAPSNAYREPDVGLGMAAPTIATYAGEKLARRFLRPLFTGEEKWCQLFSEPGAGSDLAAVSTRAEQHDTTWSVTGQKVWTSNAHNAHWAILLTRSDVRAPKHRGLTFFLLDMKSSGVTVRPLRLLTGDIEFNEVFLDDARVPDTHRLGDVGGGWAVAMTTLGNERVAISPNAEDESSLMARVIARWQEADAARSSDLRARITRLWIDWQVYGWVARRAAQNAASGNPGPEGSGLKIAFARLSQSLTGAEIELAGVPGIEYDDWSEVATEHADFTGRVAAYRYLRARGNSIEGGTSEILLNVISERVLDLPREPRVLTAAAGDPRGAR